MQSFAPSIDYIQHYSSGNFYEPPQTRRRNPYDIMQEAAFWVVYKQRKGKELNLSLPR